MKRPEIPEKVAAKFSGIYDLLINKYYFDDLWIRGFAGGGKRIGNFLWKRGRTLTPRPLCLVGGEVGADGDGYLDLFSVEVPIERENMIDVLNHGAFMIETDSQGNHVWTSEGHDFRGPDIDRW